MIYWISYYLIKLAGAIFSPRTVLGRHHIPRRGGFLIASNHISNLDPFLIGLCFNRRISYMAKDSLFRRPLAAYLLHHVGAFPVRRGERDIGALRETLRRLKNGMPVVMFPEGTRKEEGTETQIHSGIGFLAIKARVPILPVYIHGADRVLPPGTKIPKRGRVIMTFGKPLVFSEREAYSDIADCVMREIEFLASGSS